MSVYDFNHNEHLNRSAQINHQTNNNIKITVANGTQAINRHQLPNDYIGRTFTPSTHHLDLSVQLTRPTSKTAMLVRQRRAMLEQISCFICKGYLIDATTVDECMDSFCKSCIVTYLRSNSNCPKCGILIQKTDPLGSIKSDKVLQDIVYKLVPGLYDNEMKRRRDFYKNLYGPSSSSSDEDDTDGSSSSGKCYHLTGERHGVVSHPKPFYKPTDDIDLSIEPQTRNDSKSIYYDNKRQSIVTCFTGNVQQSHDDSHNQFSAVDSQEFKTYLRCPAKFTALQLKKFIAAKFNICKQDTIHLLYLNESLKDKYSLIDIAYIYDWRGIEHMRLFYIIERDLSKMDDAQPQQPQDRLCSKVKTRQSVGTSTINTTKRVCIDPSPRFYEEPADIVPQTKESSNINGRSMRPRVVDPPKPPTKTNSQPSQPILRSSFSSASKTDPSKVQIINSNGSDATKIPYGQIRYIPYPNNIVQNIVNQSNMKQSESKEVMIPNNPAEQHLSSANRNSCGPNKFNNNMIPTNEEANNSRNQQTYSRVRNDDHIKQSKPVVSERTNVGQVAPYVNRGGMYHNSNSNLQTTSSSTPMNRPTQSSLVTLASFTEARSNHVVAMSTSAAATISSYSNILSADSSTRPDFVKSEMRVANNQMLVRPSTNQSQSQPQLAFSIVTERGITIVRRMNGKNEPSAVSNMGSKQMSSNSSNNSLPMIATSTSNPAAVRPQNTSTATSQTIAKDPATSTTGSIPSESVNIHVTSPRHHIRAKPVYKTFVDPTKLKTPNHKKFGYTARH